MSRPSVVSELVGDIRYVMGITAASKHQTDDGSVFIQLMLDIQTTEQAAVPAPGNADGADSGCDSKVAELCSPKTETLTLKLTVPQFYQLLSELDEAKAELTKALDQ